MRRQCIKINARWKAYCKHSAASKISMSSVVISLIAKMISPGRIPALSAGPPGDDEITRSPVDDLSSPVG